MIDRKSNFFSQLEFTEYHRLNSVPETMSLIEAECFDIPADETTSTRTSEKGIIFALGFTATLVVLSGVQLHRSVEAPPANWEISKSQKLSTFDPKKYLIPIPARKLNRAQSLQKTDFSRDEIEILKIKNAIAHGKF